MQISLFDSALASYMEQEFGEDWRTMCHQSAKIASKALKLLAPAADIRMRRVELIAMMRGASGFAHIGWANDPEYRVLPGKMPMHFAVTLGQGLYDPTFWQLSKVRTPLDLPDVPYFYSPEFFTIAGPPDVDGFRWVSRERPSGLLGIAYLLQDKPLSAKVRAGLISDAEAFVHAKEIAGIALKIGAVHSE